MPILPTIPEMKIGLIVVTPTNHKRITANRLYIVEKIEDEMIFIKNDVGEIKPYKTYNFIEADLYFTVCLFSTVIKLFKLGSKAYE